MSPSWRDASNGTVGTETLKPAGGATIGLALWAVARIATADTVVIDFDSTPAVWGCCQNHNLSIGGFRISPSSHVDIADFGDPQGWNIAGASVAMGWDSAGAPNPDYAGPACVVPGGSCVSVDLPGETFSFLSFSWGNQPITVQSSKGGLIQFDHQAIPPETQDLAGPEWQDIQWVLFSASDPGAPTHFVDDLTFSTVPLAPAVWLFGASLATLGLARRRRVAF